MKKLQSENLSGVEELIEELKRISPEDEITQKADKIMPELLKDDLEDIKQGNLEYYSDEGEGSEAAEVNYDEDTDREDMEDEEEQENEGEQVEANQGEEGEEEDEEEEEEKEGEEDEVTEAVLEKRKQLFEMAQAHMAAGGKNTHDRATISNHKHYDV